jgi:hypothetical protein
MLRADIVDQSKTILMRYIRLIELKSGPQNLAPFFGTHFFGVRIIDADLRSHVNYVLIVSSTVDQRTFYQPLIS